MATKTAGNPGAYAVMQLDGNLVVYSTAGRALWSTRIGRRFPSNYELKVQSDEDVVIYHGSEPLWGRKDGRR